MTQYDNRADMLAQILALSPFGGKARIRDWAKRWPVSVTPLWLVENSQDVGGIDVDGFRVWLACNLFPLPVVVRCARVWADRAIRVHAPREIDKAARKLGAAGVPHDLHVYADKLRAAELGPDRDECIAANARDYMLHANSRIFDVSFAARYACDAASGADGAALIAATCTAYDDAYDLNNTEDAIRHTVGAASDAWCASGEREDERALQIAELIAAARKHQRAKRATRIQA